jgi:hypothetical protein
MRSTTLRWWPAILAIGRRKRRRWSIRSRLISCWPGAARAQHGGQWLAGVVTPAAKWVQAELFELRVCAFLV